MENDIKTFLDQLKENVDYEEEKAKYKDNADFNMRFKTYNTFHLCYHPNIPFFRYYIPLIKFDDEDLNYFVTKYAPKLKEEMNSKIEKIKQQYEKL